MNSADIEDAQQEAERFLRRIKELIGCRKPLSDYETRTGGYRRRQHSGDCPETAALRRASMDLSRSLSKMRRS